MPLVVLFVILSQLFSLNLSAKNEPYLNALTSWAQRFPTPPIRYEIRTVEKKDLKFHQLYLILGVLYWPEQLKKQPSEFSLLFQANRGEESLTELFRISDHNNCGKNSFEDWTVTPLPEQDQLPHWEIDFRFSSFGCGTDINLGNRKVINHLYLLIAETPKISIAYESRFLINGEMKFLSRPPNLLAIEYGEKDSGEFSSVKKEYPLSWNPRLKKYQLPR